MDLEQLVARRREIELIDEHERFDSRPDIRRADEPHDGTQPVAAGAQRNLPRPRRGALLFDTVDE
ncbi:hypothetical protein [Burkholderia sp. BCC1993]|uniref:hypothetical protein n=1 Tax=Burkholderia sp. BCC1993 TaxID=2817444 RepID=UPI002AB01A71|nr:hypothetical protein [Burkholderia sp. BCC1993]